MKCEKKSVYIFFLSAKCLNYNKEVYETSMMKLFFFVLRKQLTAKNYILTTNFND